MHVSVAKIFEERPFQWGLRGDPYLWNDLEIYFSNFILPYSVEDFLEEIRIKFTECTGSKLELNAFILVPQYSHGGMSSGRIDSEFWLNKALPLLAERLNKLNQEYTQ